MHSIRRKRLKILKEQFFFIPYYWCFETNMKIKTLSLICKVKVKLVFILTRVTVYEMLSWVFVVYLISAILTVNTLLLLLILTCTNFQGFWFPL